MPKLPPAALRQLAIDVFLKTGAPALHAEIVADHLVEANLAGHDSHGILRVLQYVDLIDSGLLIPTGQARVVERFTSGAVIDGQGGFGQVVAGDAMRLAIELAREAGTAAVTVRNCCHTGRLGAYSAMAAEAGLVGLVVVNAGGGAQLVAPFGGTARRLSTNPISIAAPAANGPPVVLDMSTSAAPEGKVRAAFQAGKPTPDGWLIDPQGNPTNDPGQLYADPPGALVPLGGAFAHKGYALSFMIDILAGGLTGAGTCEPGRAYPGDGMLAMAIDIARFTSLETFRQQVATLCDYIHESPKAAGCERIYVPGEPERVRREERMRDGILVQQGTWDLLTKLCQRLEVPLPAEV